MPSVGDLYVNLGIRGADKTIDAITGVKKGFGDITSMSIEAKAAILAALYGFDKLFQSSNQLGMNLTNTATLLGGDHWLQALQKYSYIAKQIGSSNEEVSSTFLALRKSAADIEMGGGPPKFMLSINEALTKGGLGAIDFKKALNDSEYFFQKLQEFASKTNVRPELKDQWLASIIGSDKLRAGMINNVFTPGALAHAPSLSDNQVKALNHTYQSESKLKSKIQLEFDKFDAKHGDELVNHVSKIVESISSLAENLDKLAERLYVFDGLNHALSFLADSLGTYADVADALSGGGKNKKGETVAGAAYQAWIKTTPVGAFFNLYKEMLNKVEHGAGGKGGATTFNQHFHGANLHDKQGMADAAKHGASQGKQNRNAREQNGNALKQNK